MCNFSESENFILSLTRALHSPVHLKSRGGGSPEHHTRMEDGQKFRMDVLRRQPNIFTEILNNLWRPSTASNYLMDTAWRTVYAVRIGDCRPFGHNKLTRDIIKLNRHDQQKIYRCTTVKSKKEKNILLKVTSKHKAKLEAYTANTAHLIIHTANLIV